MSQKLNYYYLATPYSKYPGGIVAAYEEACRQTAVLLRSNIPTFSPIAHTHGVAIYGGIDPLAHDIWLPADAPMMDRALGLIVCMMAGWDTSFGINHEIEVFSAAGKPVLYMVPGSPLLYPAPDHPEAVSKLEALPPVTLPPVAVERKGA